MVCPYFGGIVGTPCLSIVANRRGARMALVLAYFTAAGFIASLGLTMAERSLTTTILLADRGGGLLLSRNASASYIFSLCAVPALIAAIAAVTLPRSIAADDS